MSGGPVAFVLMAGLAIHGSVAAAGAASQAQLSQAPTTLTVFVGPVVYDDAIWMADERGFYQAEGLDVVLRPFPSGSTALETFRSGEGDIVINGELPSVRYWAASNEDYRVIFVVERDYLGEVGMASKSIARPQDLEGKTVATRVGSTGSWFLSEYLTKNGVDEARVTVKNLETQVMPTALCQGDIDAFFIWQPFGSRALEICPDRVHRLTTAEGYMHGYLVAAARPAWLADPVNRDATIRFMRATFQGRAVAESDFPAVAEYVGARFGMSEQAAREAWEVMERPFVFDETFYRDYCNLAQWMRDRGMLDRPLDFSGFLWLDGVRELAPDRFVPPPAGC